MDSVEYSTRRGVILKDGDAKGRQCSLLKEAQDDSMHKADFCLSGMQTVFLSEERGLWT